MNKTAIKEWLRENAILDTERNYRSKIDGSYLTRHTMLDQIEFIVRAGLTQVQNTSGIPEHTANIGFKEEEQKWYGWSHRAMYGFGIGSQVVKGDCAYSPTDKDDFLEDMVRFWTEPEHLNVKGEHYENWNDEGRAGVYVTWEYSDTIPNEKIRGNITGSFSPYPENYGKGEWTAETLEDAKQMAKDFAEGVS